MMIILSKIASASLKGCKPLVVLAALSVYLDKPSSGMEPLGGIVDTLAGGYEGY